MTTHTSSGSFANSTLANMQAWMVRALAALDAVGTRTADTGQIVPAQLTTLPGIAMSSGFAMYRLGGAKQDTHPVFIRVDLGAGATRSTAPGIAVTVGRGTDGAGTVTGVLYQGLMAGSGGNNVTGDGLLWRASGGDDHLILIPTIGTTAAGMPFFLVERSPDGGSIMVLDARDGGVSAVQNVSTSSSPALTSTSWSTGVSTIGSCPVLLPRIIAGASLTTGTPLAAASLAPVFPWVLFAPSQAPWQARSGLSYPGGDAPGDVFQVTLEGEERTYMPIPISESHNAFGYGIGAGSTSRHVGLAIRWE